MVSVMVRSMLYYIVFYQFYVALLIVKKVYLNYWPAEMKTSYLLKLISAKMLESNMKLIKPSGFGLKKIYIGIFLYFYKWKTTS